jgi:hypothetical protein
MPFVLMGSILSLEVALFQRDEDSPAMDRCQELEIREVKAPAGG